MRLKAVRILFVNNFPGPGIGGGEVQLLQVMEGCLAAGMDVRLMAVAGGELEARARRLGVRFVPFPAARRALAMLSVLRGELRGGGVDIVHTTGYLTNQLGRIATRGRSVKLANTYHCELDASLADGGSRLSLRARLVVDRRTIGRVDALIAVSSAIAQDLERLGAPKDRVRVIPNGVDVEQVRGRAGEADVRGRPARGPDGGGRPPVAGTVARLEPVKGIDVLVDAAAKIVELVPDARIRVVGEGSQSASLRAAAPPEVEFLGLVSPMESELARMDVVAVPSRSEGQGIVALEAMALGKPVVASRVGGLPEVVEDGKTGLLVPPEDTKALAEAVAGLLADPQRAIRMGEAGLARVRECFRVDDMVQRHLSLYEEMLAIKGSA